MTREDIIRMARETGVEWLMHNQFYKDHLQNFAALIASRVAAAARAEEREECARIAEEPSSQAYDVLVVAGEFRTENNIRLPKHSHDIAKEIRAREFKK